MATGLTADALFRLKAHNQTAPEFEQVGKNLQRLDQQAQKVDRAFGQMKGFQEFTRMAAGFMASGAVLGFGKSVISAGDEIADMADITGFGVESIQSLMIVAKDAGVRMDRLRNAIGDLQGKMAEASVEGGEKLAAAFARLGVSADMLASGNTEAVFERIAIALRAGAGDAKITAAAHDVLGGSVEKLAPVFNAAANGMAAMNAEMKASGEIMDKTMVDQLAQADRVIQRIGNMAKIYGAMGLQKVKDFGVGAMAAGAGVSHVFSDIGSGRLPLFGTDQQMSDSFDAGAGFIYATPAEEKAKLRPLGLPGMPSMEPGNYVSEASRNAYNPDWDPLIQEQGKLITALDALGRGVDLLTKQMRSRNSGPIGP